MKPCRFTLALLATLGLLSFAGMLFSGRAAAVPDRVAVVGPIGAAAMGIFATGCAAGAARAGRGGQRRAWTVLAAGLAGWTCGEMAWCYVGLGGVTEFSQASIADLGFLVLPLFALAAGLVVPSQDGFGIGLLLDGIVVAASLLLILSVLVVGHAGPSADQVGIPKLVMVTVTAIYLGLLVMALIVTRTVPSGRKLSPTLIAVGFGVIAAAGLVRVFAGRHDEIASNTVILGWVAGIYFFALSGMASRPPSDLDTGLSRSPSWLALWMPYLTLSVATLVGAVHLWPLYRGDAFIFSVGLVVVGAALIRHMVLLNLKQRLAAAVAHAAAQDTVTGLANRRLFDRGLALAVQSHSRVGAPVTVLSLRVDDFNVVNDTLGYAASDALLRSAGARMLASLRTGDTLARMGGDEFAILVKDRADVGAQVAETIARSFDRALEIGGNQVYVRISIGVVSADSEHRASPTARDLLDRAEAARFRAELTSATNVQIFTPEIDAYTGRRQAFRDGVARLQLLSDLRRAIDDRMFTLVYQPQFEMVSGAVCGAEALLRWEHPTLGILEPHEFLPLVREHRLMDAMTNVVLSQAVSDASGWHEMGTAIRVAINLWAPNLTDATLPDRILSALNSHGMPASLLTVEITEELVVADFAQGRAVLNRLRQTGIRIAIDDFGSGYSTLTYLRELPIDEVKLDRQLVAPILCDRRAATIARSVIELAGEFGIASVAEGVENEETVAWLRGFGCDAAQGNHLCHPLPASQIPGVAATGATAR